jgi:hypothetical protein
MRHALEGGGIFAGFGGWLLCEKCACDECRIAGWEGARLEYGAPEGLLFTLPN